MNSVFESKTPLPDKHLKERSKTLLGFDDLYGRVSRQLKLLLHADEVEAWSRSHHKKVITAASLLRDQYPFAIFHGDVGTGKTAMAEAVANRIATDSKTEDSQLFKLSNRVRGTGNVGEMGSLIASAFAEIKSAIGKTQHAILIIDEGDSLATSRSQQQSHHEDRVAVNTVIQAIDSLRSARGRIFTILCTNRMSALDPAIIRRASIIEHFQRPTNEQRAKLFQMDLDDLALTPKEMATLVDATAATEKRPAWTYSDIRTRLYPAAIGLAFPDEALAFSHFKAALATLSPSPMISE